MTTTTTRTITVTKRDGTTKSVESPYTDSEALAKLDHYCFSGAQPLGRSGFACDLANTACTQRGLSEKQFAWVHIIVVEFEAPREAPAPAATLPRIRRMIDAAGTEIKWPKVTLETEGGQTIRLARAGDRSRKPGHINVTDGRPFGDNTFYGSIDLEGNLIPASSMNDEVLGFLTTFDAQPEVVATAYGLRTGACCFCSRELTDGRSVAMGYGPICAEHYGLPWGDERVGSTVEVSVVNVEAQDAVPHDDPEGCPCGSPNCTDGNDGEAIAADQEAAHDRAAGRG